jgi:XapX domain-containing protein
MKSVIGLLLGFALGAACRFFDIPVPSPPKLLGALQVVTTTLGYMAADQLLTSRKASAPPPRETTQARVSAPAAQSAPVAR